MVSCSCFVLDLLFKLFLHFISEISLPSYSIFIEFLVDLVFDYENDSYLVISICYL